jgi:hypothetical protein
MWVLQEVEQESVQLAIYVAVQQERSIEVTPDIASTLCCAAAL